MGTWLGFRPKSAVELPRWVPVRQDWGPRVEAPVEQWVAREFRRPEIAGTIEPGSRVAIAVGSRGISRLQEVVRATVAEVSRRGASPFIVPAMGSHGGATAEGQAKVLANYGITPAGVGAPVVSEAEVLPMGQTVEGVPVFTDAAAARADAIIVINRVKPHTSYRGPVESGVAKMLVIGLGKDAGARAMHSRGTQNFTTLIPSAASVLLRTLPVAFGLALVEGSYGELAYLEAIPAAQILARETELLVDARRRMPRLPSDDLDVLVVHEIGKDVSGAGMDPNITGRYPVPFLQGDIRIDRLAVLNLTETTAGNGVGIGMADLTTLRVAEGLDFHAMYTNTITGSGLVPAKVPLVAADDRAAIELATISCVPKYPGRLRLAWVRDTKHLERAYLSEALWADLKGRQGLEALGEPEPIRFTPEGRLHIPAHGPT